MRKSSATAKSKKLPWVDMALTRVKLNSEQAVLSCCKQPERGMLNAPAGQCTFSGPCGAEGMYISS